MRASMERELVMLRYKRPFSSSSLLCLQYSPSSVDMSLYQLTNPSDRISISLLASREFQQYRTGKQVEAKTERKVLEDMRQRRNRVGNGVYGILRHEISEKLSS